MVNRRLADTVSALQGLSLGCISYQKSSNHKLSGFGRLKSSPAPQTPPPQPSNTKVWLSSQGQTPHTYLFLRGALFRGYLGCRRSRSVLGLRNVGDVRIFFFL